MVQISEFTIQKTFVDWARKQDFVLLCFSVPNGFKSNSQNAIMMKKEGMLNGIPDTITVLKNGKIAWIEFKTSTGILSDAQKKVIGLLEEGKQYVTVCRSTFEATSFIRSLLD